LVGAERSKPASDSFCTANKTTANNFFEILFYHFHIVKLNSLFAHFVHPLFIRYFTGSSVAIKNQCKTNKKPIIW